MLRKLQRVAPRWAKHFSTSAVCKEESTPVFFEYYRDATAAFGSGNIEESILLNEKALKEAAIPDTSVNWKDVAAVELNQAHLLKLMSRLAESRTLALSALRRLDSHFSTSKSEVCFALDVLAELSNELQSFDEALDYINRSIEVKSRLHGPSGPPLAKSYNVRGAVYMSLGSLAQSRSDFIRALGINVHYYGRPEGGPLALPIGISLSNIAGVIRKENNTDTLPQCIEVYREVVKSFESAASKDSKESWILGNAITDLAECLIDTKCSEYTPEIQQLLTRSLHIFLASRGLNHPSTERTAWLLKAVRDPTRSIEQVPSMDICTLTRNTSFVDTLLKESERVAPKKTEKITGDVIFLDRRGHVGFGHPHSPLI